jgi:outer membrane protein assembly factor BamB
VTTIMLKVVNMQCRCLLPVLLAIGLLSAGDPVPARADDWPMLGGRPDRNMVSPEKNLPATWKEADKKQLKWVAKLGTQTYGNPVVSEGRVFIGTNNGQPRNPAIQGDRGVLMCFSAPDGTFLWQAVHEKLSTGNAEDWVEIGICSTPCVAGDRVYYVSNRAELVCADAEGFADGENDGPFTSESATGAHDADFVWLLDMRKELGISPYQASASSPLVVGDLVFVVTGQGVGDQTHVVKNPEAPSFIAVDRRTGKIAWQDSSPGERILEGQWGSPAYGVVEGRPQVAFPGGDGWLYAFRPATGELLWKFNCKAHEKIKNGRPETRNQLLATPVYSGSRVLIAVGPNPEAGGTPGALRAIDARKRGDVTGSAELWRTPPKAFGGSISTVAVHEGLVYAIELDGFVDCFELDTGKRVWRHDLLATVWGSPLVADGKVYVRNEDGDVVVLEAGREKKVLATNTLPGLSHGTVVAAGGVLYIAGDKQLYAVVAGD